MTDSIQTDVVERILQIRIVRPERKNALTHTMYDALAAALLQADEQSEIRAIFITGTDDCFTSGNDVQDFLSHPPSGPDSPVFRFMRTLQQCRKPVVAAVNGPAVGIGATLLLHCDLVYLGPDAKLQMPFVKLGLCPEYASSLLVPAMVGHRRATELLLLGDTLRAEEAVSAGIANAVFDEYYQEKAFDKAREIAALPPAAIRMAKRLMKEPVEEQISRQIAREGAAFVERLASPEAREAMMAFMQKRPADFSAFE
ncbi:enoyl-CoA hydratase [Kistimonas asteriae]|uniref:enoyl-CoA hydratase n=1 Tax=Kistimonas asteriae TaxID=517724 RepID=UPI001BA4611F|nr:enoyl-CoA hydratase [Kistimonas asteriae]